MNSRTAQADEPDRQGRSGGIAVVMITKDAAARLAEVLESVRGFPEVVILDSGSRDGTIEIAGRFANVNIHQAEFLGFGPMKNKAVDLAERDWILSLDDDEVLSPDLADEILSLDLRESSVYALPFRNFFGGRWIRGCGWHPQWKTRLFNRRRARFSDAKVHESLRHEGLDVGRLENPVFHFTAESVEDLQDKERLYSALFVEQNAGRRNATLVTAMLKGGYAFVRCYLFQRGIACGADGFIISAHAGVSRFYRYLKLREANRRR